MRAWAGVAMALFATGCSKVERPRPVASTRSDVSAFASVKNARESLSARDLKVTLGSVRPKSDGALGVDDAKVRFVAPDTVADVAMRFTYVGPSAKEARLASGAMRRQVGLKLRAHDGCNVVYVMWRFEPVNELVVSVKSNPGESLHLECGASGYTNVKADRRATMPAIERGSSHAMTARIDGRRLFVTVDGNAAWEGRLPESAFLVDGPSGVRTDNVAVDVAFAAMRGKTGDSAGGDD